MMAAHTTSTPALSGPSAPLPPWADRLRRMVAGGAARCPTKTRYGSEQAARGAALTILRSGEATVARLWVYACPHCRRWHMTSQATGDVAVTSAGRYEGVPS